MTDPAAGSSGRPPEPPAGKPSWLVLLYAALGVITIGLYLAAGILGWSWADEERGEVPQSARQAPGGYRTYRFWHSGYSGGK